MAKRREDIKTVDDMWILCYFFLILLLLLINKCTSVSEMCFLFFEVASRVFFAISNFITNKFLKKLIIVSIV